MVAMGLRSAMHTRMGAARHETLAVYLACRDPRVPWFAKLVGGIVLAYALSPVDLIPDFIPVLGYLDDLVIIPAGVVLVRKMIPCSVMAEHRATAAAHLASGGRGAWIAAGVVIACWVSLAVVSAVLIL